MLVATYDYWGYYNVCFLGDEVKEPDKTYPAGAAAIHSAGGMSIRGDERQHSGSGALAGNDGARASRIAGLYVVSIFMERIYGPWAANLATGAGDVDGVRFGVFADAGLLAGALRRGAGWKLFSRFRAGASAAPLSLCFTAGAGWRGGAVLLSFAGGCDRGAGGDSHHCCSFWCRRLG